MKEKILLSASLFHALNDAASIITPMVFPILYSQGSLITSYAQIGLLSNLGLLVTLLVQFAVVRLSYEVEYKYLMLLSLAGICLSLAAVTLATSFLSLLALFLLLRLFSSFYHPVVIAWVSRSQSAEGLDSAMGIQSGSGNVGVFLGFLSVGYIAQVWGWKAPLLAWAVFGLILGGIGLAAIRNVSSRSDRRPALNVASWMRSLKGVSNLVPGFIFGGVGWSVAVYYAPSLLNHKFGIPMGRTGLYLALWIGLGTFSGYGYGYLSRKIGRRTVFLSSLAGGSASLFLIGFAGSRTLAVAGLLALGAFLLLTYPSLQTFVGSSVVHDDQTQAFSWVSNIQMLAGAAISLLAGILSDRIGIHFAFIMSGALVFFIFLYYGLRKNALSNLASAPAPRGLENREITEPPL